MATPSLVQIDDRNPLVFYSPNSSWTRGGNTADFDDTSTFTATQGASATLTFTGTGISVWGTITFLAPNTPTYVLSSYSVDNGPATTFNATEQASFQFQQKLFQSAQLTASTHTIVVTVANDATFFIDYFLVIPATSSGTVASNPSLPPSSSSDSSSLPSTGTVSPASATSKSASSSMSSNSFSPTGTMTVAGAGATSEPDSLLSDSSTLSHTLSTISTAGAGAQSHSSRVSLGAVVGGSLGGLALLIIAIFAVWLSRKRLKDENRRLKSQAQGYSDPHINPALPMQQYQPPNGSDRVLEYPTISSYSQLPTLPTSSAGVIPPSKAAQLSRPREDSLYSRTLSGSPEPPGYYG